MPKVEELSLFPVKGARAEHPAVFDVDPETGIRGDRRFAIKRSADQPDAWAAKVHFQVCMNTPQMAAQTPLVARAGAEAALDPRWLDDVAAAIGEKAVATLDTKGAYSLVDTDPHKYGPTISFLNLASVRVLAAETGWTIDPERFRMNIWYDDGMPFSELAWADAYPGTRELTIGALHLRLHDACERCQAPEANPTTGQRDLPILEALVAMMRKRGYKGSPHRGVFHVMGFLARPLNRATVRRGEEIRAL